jgi:hypothetical protein
VLYYIIYSGQNIQFDKFKETNRHIKMNGSNENVFVTVTQDILDQLALLTEEDILDCTIENASRTGLIKAWYPTVVTTKKGTLKTKLGQNMIEKLPVLHKYLPRDGNLKRRILNKEI